MTGDAGLIRPGRSRPANQRTAGRLERVEARLTKVRGLLGGAEIVLEDLLGSQEKLDELGQELETLRAELKQGRGLEHAWDEWTRRRKQRRDAHRRVIELERALADLDEQESARCADDTRLGESFSEYRAPGFPFDEKRRALEDLVARDRERTETRRKLEGAREKLRRLGEQVLGSDQEIGARYAAFAKNPHLLRDFEEWSQVATDLEQLSEELEALQKEEEQCTETITLLSHWAELDPEGTFPQPLTRLEELRETIPRLLGRARELAALTAELGGLEERLQGPLKIIADSPEEIVREAAAHSDRHQLHRVETSEAARRLEDLEAARRELEQRELAYLNLEESLTAKIATAAAEPTAEAPAPLLAPESTEPVPPPSSLPPAWAAALAALERKLEVAREETQLLKRIDAAERGIRAGIVRSVSIPALVTLIVIGSVVYGLGLLNDLTLVVHHGLTWGCGALGAAIAGIVAHRRGKGAFIRNLGRARGRLAVVRRSIAQADRSLNDLAELDTRELRDLIDQLTSFGRMTTELASLRELAPSREELERAGREAQEADRDLTAFEARMAPLGEDPEGLVAEWRATDRRAQEIALRLPDLQADVGLAQWAEAPIAELPSAWEGAARLAGVVVEILATDEERANGAAELTTGEEVVTWLERISPDLWERWSDEAGTWAAAHARAREILARRKALLGDSDDAGNCRVDQLRMREADLARACRPFPRTESLEELSSAHRTFEGLKGQRERSQTLMDDLQGEIPPLEQALQAADEGLNALRDGLRGLLRPASSDPATALARLNEAAQLRAALQQAESVQMKVLRSHDMTSLEDLRIRLAELREESGQSGARLRELEETFVLLHEITDAQPEEIQTRRNELGERIVVWSERVQHLENQRETVRSRAADAEAEGRRIENVAVLEVEIARLAAEQVRLRDERDAIRLAFEILRDAEHSYSQTHRERLEERATEMIRTLSLSAERAIQLGPRFEIQVLAEDGQPCAIRQLSQGARDQLALALRLSVADLLAGGITPPLFFDDPFLSFDPERLSAIRALLDRVAQERQVLLLSHRPEIEAWGRAIEVRGEPA